MKKITLPDSRSYEGELKDSVPHGQGSATYPDGETYVGEWKDGEKEDLDDDELELILSSLQSTVDKDNIATSFSIKGNSYIVSTVLSYSNGSIKQRSTVIKKIGLQFSPILEVGCPSAPRATENHIALVRMATSTPQSKWSKLGLGEFMPTLIMDELSEQSITPDNFNSKYCDLLLRMSGINATKRKGFLSTLFSWGN